jgi:hypothetical protein
MLPILHPLPPDSIVLDCRANGGDNSLYPQTKNFISVSLIRRNTLPLNAHDSSVQVDDIAAILPDHLDQEANQVQREQTERCRDQ